MDTLLKPKPWYVKFRYYILAGVCFVALLAYAIVVSLSPKQMRVQDDEITIATVQDGKFMEYVDVEGIVQPILTLKVNSMESGFVQSIVADEGDMLSKGDTILVLSNPDLMAPSTTSKTSRSASSTPIRSRTSRCSSAPSPCASRRSMPSMRCRPSTRSSTSLARSFAWA